VAILSEFGPLPKPLEKLVDVLESVAVIKAGRLLLFPLEFMELPGPRG